jgi:hypothetical protein
MHGMVDFKVNPLLGLGLASFFHRSEFNKNTKDAKKSKP